MNKKTEIGIVYNPILDEMFSARAGQGAFCNDTRLAVSSTQGKFTYYGCLYSRIG